MYFSLIFENNFNASLKFKILNGEGREETRIRPPSPVTEMIKRNKCALCNYLRIFFNFKNNFNASQKFKLLHD